MLEKAVGSEDFRRRAAEAALGDVEPGMKLGLGSGRTAEAFISALGERVRGGLDVVGVATSERTAVLATSEGIRLTTLDDEPELDLTVDGADEIDPRLRLIKGGGGALLREKIIATASRRLVIVADAGKRVESLGAFPLPVEVAPFGLKATCRALERTLADMQPNASMKLRRNGARPYVTDGGHYIVDVSCGRISDPETLAQRISCVPGVVEHGLFIGIASAAAVAGPGGLERLSP